ncbi:acetyltransferase [Synechococcus sp. CS-1330]|nr:acetyltransferase [Synechococcus sp. CS-1330]
MRQLNRRCIIWGATGQTKVAYDILIGEGAEIIHLFDNNPSVESPLPGIPISHGPDGMLSFIDALRHQKLNPSDIDCIAAIGGTHGEARETMTLFMESHGFKPRPLIHKSAIISPCANIGKNVQLLAGSIIGAFVSIGDYSIINTGANVDHDCTIGRNCHLAPRAALAGEITVEDNVFVGTNATILPRLRICAGSTVGAGAVVTKDVAPGAVVAGNPARPLVK